MVLISEPTTPPGGVSATTGAVGSGGGGDLCTGLGFGCGAVFLGGGTQSGTAVEGGSCAVSAGGDATAGGTVPVLSSVGDGALVATGGSNEVLGVGPGLLFMLPHAEDKATAVTQTKRLAARI